MENEIKLIKPYFKNIFIALHTIFILFKICIIIYFTIKIYNVQLKKNGITMMCYNTFSTTEETYYVDFSREASPKASACFLAFSLKSAILEFLCAAARAAKPSGYWG